MDKRLKNLDRPAPIFQNLLLRTSPSFFCRSLFRTILCKPLEMVVRENPSRSAVFEILRPDRLAPTTIPRSKSLKSPSDARFDLQQIIFTTSRCLHALSCCHVNWVLLLTMSIPLWLQCTHLLMTTSSRIIAHVTKLKSSQTGFLNMTMCTIYSNALHSHQISIQPSTFGMW